MTYGMTLLGLVLVVAGLIAVVVPAQPRRVEAKRGNMAQQSASGVVR
jgi:uncharacterized protein YjeT (DUF2065 family)